MNATAAFRLGLIGAGRMGQTHLRALRSSVGVKVTAIAEPNAAVREALETGGAALFADAGEMLSADHIDGVLVASPSSGHLDLVTRAAAAGLPILCEKPCGLTTEEARHAAQIASVGGVLLQVGYWRRFVPALRQLRQRIEAGEFGLLYHVACHQWDENPPPRSFRAGSGGAFIDMGVHEFDQLRWLTGQEIGSVKVVASTVAYDVPVTGDPDSATALCQMSGGATGLVSLGRRFPLGDACWLEIFGTQGFEDNRFLWPPAGDAVFLDALRAQVEAFVFAARGGACAGATANDAVAALEAAERCKGYGKS